MEPTYHQSNGISIEGENMPFNNLRKQVKRIVEDKIKRISAKEFVNANQLKNGIWRKKHVPYTLPVIITDLVSMAAELADENTTGARIEEIASFATNGEVFEKAF